MGTVPVAIETPQVERQGDARPGVGAVAAADLPLVEPGQTQVDDDRNLPILRLVRERPHLDAVEVAAAAEGVLVLEHLVGPERFARPEHRIALEQLRVERRLVEADRSEPVAFPGGHPELERRSVARQVDADLRAVVARVEVAQPRGVGRDRVLALAPEPLVEHVAALQGKLARQPREGGVVRAGTVELDVGRGDVERRPRIDVVARQPTAVRTLIEAAVDP